MKPELKMDYNFTARWRQTSPAEISSGKFNRTFANVIFVIIVVDETIGPIAAAAAADLVSSVKLFYNLSGRPFQSSFYAGKGKNVLRWNYTLYVNNNLRKTISSQSYQ